MVLFVILIMILVITLSSLRIYAIYFNRIAFVHNERIHLNGGLILLLYSGVLRLILYIHYQLVRG
jgi:hypothetical protein